MNFLFLKLGPILCCLSQTWSLAGGQSETSTRCVTFPVIEGPPSIICWAQCYIMTSSLNKMILSRLNANDRNMNTHCYDGNRSEPALPPTPQHTCPHRLIDVDNPITNNTTQPKLCTGCINRARSPTTPRQNPDAPSLQSPLVNLEVSHGTAPGKKPSFILMDDD